MKKTMTIEKKNNKVIITYFNGEYSEWLTVSMDSKIATDEIDVGNKLFNVLVNILDEKIRSTMIELGIGIEEKGIGKHLFKYDKK